MGESVLFSRTFYPARTVGWLIIDSLGRSEYMAVRTCLENDGNKYMLDVLSDVFLISGISFFDSLRTRSMKRILCDIYAMTPSIYYLLFIKLTEKEIHDNFPEYRRILTERCFLMNDVKRLMSHSDRQKFIDYAKLLLHKERHQCFADSESEHLAAWNKVVQRITNRI